jgi:hypothetical protein
MKPWRQLLRWTREGNLTRERFNELHPLCVGVSGCTVMQPKGYLAIHVAARVPRPNACGVGQSLLLGRDPDLIAVWRLPCNYLLLFHGANLLRFDTACCLLSYIVYSKYMEYVKGIWKKVYSDYAGVL